MSSFSEARMTPCLPSIGAVILATLAVTTSAAPAVQGPSPSPTPSATASPPPSPQPIPRPSPHVHASYPTTVGPESSARLQQLVEELASPEASVRADAARRLGQAGSFGGVAATGHLVGALGDNDATVREKAAEALGHTGGPPEAVRGLITALGDKVSNVRRAAADSLGAIGPGAAPAGSALAALVGDADPKVRQAAAVALGKIGTTSPDVLDALSVALHVRDDPALRERAALALGQPYHGEAALTILLAALNDPDAAVRREVVHAIAAMPTTHAGHMEPPLRRVVASETEARVRIEALHALVRLGGVGVAGLSEALADRDNLVRWWAIIHLKELGGAAGAAIPGLEHVAASDPEEWIRASAQRALEAVRAGVTP